MFTLRSELGTVLFAHTELRLTLEAMETECLAYDLHPATAARGGQLRLAITRDPSATEAGPVITERFHQAERITDQP